VLLEFSTYIFPERSNLSHLSGFEEHYCLFSGVLESLQCYKNWLANIPVILASQALQITMATPQIPFTVNILEENDSTKAQGQTQHFQSLLPATSRTETDSIETPQPTLKFLEKEILVKRLNAIQEHLWVCGRPMPARPLHTQAQLGRNITITENMELHLVWSKGRIFIKPIPLYLLDADFWTAHLMPTESKLISSKSKLISEETLDKQSERQQQLYSCALGFLFSYTGLIAYESDFKIAQSSNLIPTTIAWSNWQTLTSQFLTHHCYATVNPRYWYGELRLTRLNKVYRFKKGFRLRGYSKVGDNAFYDDILRDNFAALAAVLAYVAIALTAMQLGIATDELGHNTAFQRASYGLTVFSIIVPMIVTVFIAFGVVVLVVSNWAATKSYERRRFEEMGVEAFWRKQKQEEAKD
jgi:hypothetical protein